MLQTDADTLAMSIIKSNIYLTLGTTDGVHPWCAPLYYCFDGKRRLYVISQPHSLHIRHIATHPRVSFAIFDSHAAEGTGNGVQGSGSMKECSESQLKTALRYYHTDFIPCTEESFTHGPYRLYRIDITRMYVLDPNAKTDTRVRVQKPKK